MSAALQTREVTIYGQQFGRVLEQQRLGQVRRCRSDGKREALFPNPVAKACFACELKRRLIDRHNEGICLRAAIGWGIAVDEMDSASTVAN